MLRCNPPVGAALRVLGGGVSIGPVLLGAALPVHVVTRSITVRGLVNSSALAVAETANRILTLSDGRLTMAGTRIAW